MNILLTSHGTHIEEGGDVDIVPAGHTAHLDAPADEYCPVYITVKISLSLSHSLSLSSTHTHISSL